MQHEMFHKLAFWPTKQSYEKQIQLWQKTGMGLRTAFQDQRQSKEQLYSRPRPRLEQVVQGQGQTNGLQHQGQGQTSGPPRQGHYYLWNKTMYM